MKGNRSKRIIKRYSSITLIRKQIA